MSKALKTKFNISLFFCLLIGSFFSTACSSVDRKVFVYGFGDTRVPKTYTITDIDQHVREKYGANLFWSPR